jgi:tRNA dimethylallyltransferase
MSKSLQKKPKVIVIVGPTASGKTGLSIDLARKHNGEIVSADSRQVYKGLDIGTEKISVKDTQGVPHHLIDVAMPEDTYTVIDFKRDAERAVKDIMSRGKLPIVVGGTGFYIEALMDNKILPDVPPNKTLRKKLEQYSNEELLMQLQERDPDRAQNIDPENKRRLVRALEIIDSLGSVPREENGESKYDTLFIGVETDDDVLRKKIDERLEDTLEKGLIEEVEKLHENGLSWERLYELGLEYRLVSLYLQNKTDHSDMIKEMKKALWNYAKRQKIWFKRNKRIKWFSLSQASGIENTVKKFIR